ncbi:MAG: DNA mismatch repair protein MutS, partial [Methanomicrobium sp.]|nr:DNA mismatch repair protein MutS [Methanomicrobium sp.]
MSKEGPTPAMLQFYEMKRRYPGTVLFFQMGDFYETFGEDAEVVSRELEITLTSRGRDADGEKMPLAGVPIHAGEMYISRLVRKGYRVAVCDQIEDPKKAKGIVKRDVVRIITPGTMMDAGMFNTSGPSYLMSIFYDKKRSEYGTAFLDISTGEFFISSSNAGGGAGKTNSAAEVGSGNAFADLNSDIAKYMPSECVVQSPINPALAENLKNRGILVTPYRESAFDYDTASEYLKKHFGVSSLEGYGCIGMESSIRAAGACLAYACETQMSDLSHVRGLSTRLPSGSMILDAITLRNLEVLENIRSKGTDTSLFGTLNATKTAMGMRILRKYVTAPLINRNEIEKRLDAVEYFVKNPMIRSSLRECLDKFSDIERIAGRISYGNAGPRDLVTLKNSLDRIPLVKLSFDSGHGAFGINQGINTCGTGEISRASAVCDGDAGGINGGITNSVPELIAKALAGTSEMQAVKKLIESAITDDPPVLAKGGGVIREGYDKSLDELRYISVSGKDWIADFQQTERERTGIKSLKVGYNKVFGYFIEVTKSNMSMVPKEYIRKQTTANGERYTLPELQEKESLIANAEEKLIALEYELYQDLILKLKSETETLQKTAQCIGLLDVYSTLGAVSHSRNYVRPVIEDSKRLLISGGRHPVVERNLSAGFVPNDAQIDASENQILIITGANMAGKSTYMREVALITVMAQAGCFVPAENAVIGIVDRIFTRVGAFDDLSSGQSTFMVEMLELANILNNVTDRSLVILDEIGRGTSTLDGYSIAKAVLEFLHGKGGE